ncbi:MAG: alanine racemase [Clostridia bacterium]|nr:alanine racemase [Clostridia bacterium]
MKLLKRSWADISLDNLAHNYTQLRGNVPSSCKFLGVVKADAYGHGAVPISHYLRDLGADYLAVSNIEEALQLRRGDIRLPILILGYTPAIYAEDLVDMNIRQEVHSLEYAQQLNQHLEGTDDVLPVHIKLDTGMSRLGFFAYDCEQTLDELKAVAALPHLHIEGVFMHFPVADSHLKENEDFTRLQYQRFLSMLDSLKGLGIEPELRHCCNSAASILYPEYALDMIRPGIATYGIAPSDELRGEIDLRPLMSLHTSISQIRTFAPNISVSYGRTYTTSESRKIAVLTIGYADGLNRNFSNQISFLLHGKRVPVVGRICMDMCMVDVTEVDNVKVGDKVTVFGTNSGAEIPVEELSDALHTIPYEVLCGINKRIPRIYLDGKNRMEVLQYIV